MDSKEKNPHIYTKRGHLTPRHTKTQQTDYRTDSETFRKSMANMICVKRKQMLTAKIFDQWKLDITTHFIRAGRAAFVKHFSMWILKRAL